jgi:hypothetical protein
MRSFNRGQSVGSTVNTAAVSSMLCAGLARLTPWMVIGFTAMFCLPVQAERISYTFTKLATLGDSAPHTHGPFHINDFEPGAINNRGDVIYGTDLGTSTDPATFFGEGVFLRNAGQTTELELARALTNAPGGGIFDFLLLGQTALNDQGDGAFAFTLRPFDQNASPFGLNSGVYRYSHLTGKVTAVVVPYVTRAPAGGKFAGVGFDTRLNNRGDLLFTGIASTHTGLAYGVYKADMEGRITSVVSPGDAAPGGGSFDSAFDGWVNQAGDVAFDAHLAAETGAESGRASLYFKNAGTGTIKSIAHAGDAAPRGGVFRSLYSPVLNDSGDIVFLGDLSPGPASPVFQDLGVYLHSGGTTIAVARPGDPMPGGGNFVTASFIVAENVHINNAGEVVFNAKLDTDANGDGFPDTGLYLWSHGSLRLVVRTGTVIPGVGTVSQLVWTAFISFPLTASYVPNSGAINNDRGQVLFGATLTDGRGVLLMATPHEGDHEDDHDPR